MKLLCKDNQYFEALADSCDGIDLALVEVGMEAPSSGFDKIVYVGDNVDLGRVLTLLHEVRSVAVVQRNQRIKNDLEYAQRLTQFGDQLFTQPMAVQLPNLEFNERVDFTSHMDKSKVVSKAEELIQRSGVQNVSDTLRSIVEELFMNAIFDAPREAIKKGWGVDYVRGKSCSFDFGYDAENFCISCSDPFGSLDVDYLLQRLKIVFDKGAGQSINFGEGGAGLGCFILLENSVQMTIAVRAKKMTFFSCLVPRWSSRKDRVLNSKSLHVVRYL